MMFAPRPETWTAAIDGGTTNTRVRLLRGLELVVERHARVGARDVAAGQREALVVAVRDCLRSALSVAGAERADRIVASGMLTSEVGIAQVAHVVAPVGIDELARGAHFVTVPEIVEQPILLVPGVRALPCEGPMGWMRADVMRGEECETLGAWSLMMSAGAECLTPPPRWFLWPGSHTKLVRVDEGGRIESSHTTLAGELIAAVAAHTVLAASLPRELPRELDPIAVDQGARCVREYGLGRAAFLVRIAALFQDWTEDQRAAFWIAAVVADDVEQLAHRSLLGAEPEPSLHVGGARPLRELYVQLLRARLAARVHARDDDVPHAAIGAALVAERRESLMAGS